MVPKLFLLIFFLHLLQDLLFLQNYAKKFSSEIDKFFLNLNGCVAEKVREKKNFTRRTCGNSRFGHQYSTAIKGGSCTENLTTFI